MHEEVVNGTKVNSWLTFFHALLQIVLFAGWIYWFIDAINNEQWIWMIVSLTFAGWELFEGARLIFRVCLEAKKKSRRNAGANVR